jgi:DNA-binding SARP family transcriptional activator
MLGVFRAFTASRACVFSGTAQRILAYLALNGAAARAQLAGELWPDHSQSQAQSDLRTALWRLHQVSRAFVESTGDLLSLHESISVDVDDVIAWANEAISPTTMTFTERNEPPRGAGLELLPGRSDSWLEPHRTRLRMLQTQAYECVAARLLAAGRVPEALPYALQVLQGDPLRESAQHLMLEIHLRQGNVGAALQQYEAYRVLLAGELGIEPGLRVTTLVGQYVGRGRLGQPGRTMRPPGLGGTPRAGRR